MPTPLIEGEVFYRRLAQEHAARGTRPDLASLPQSEPALHCQRIYAPASPPGGNAAGPVLKVRIEDGRWLVDCPWCGSAQVAVKNDKRFFCVECLSAGVGGLTVPVEWPQAVARIERALEARPDPRTRQWAPGESAAALERENTDHGVK